MAKHIALLRGINVGGKNAVPMAALRNLFESLGHTDVATYIQSGNVMFSAHGAVTPKPLEAAFEAEFGVNLTVVLRTPRELERIVTRNPFADADLSKLHVGFMADKPPAGTVAKIDAARFEPETFAIVGRDLYLHLPNGMGRTKLFPSLDRQLSTPTTVRNWNTVTKLVALAQRDS